MDCGTSLVKYILFIFNTIVSIIGILGIVFGVFILQNIGVIEVNGQTGFPPQAALPIGLIVLSSVVLFISFLGCCGAIRESVCMTMCYAVLMLILLIVQLTLVVLLFTNKEKYTQAMGDIIDESWELNKTKPGIFDIIQESLHCCGKNGATDYVGVPLAPLPDSCCPNKSCVGSLSLPYGGCRAKFQEFMAGTTETAKYVGIGLIVVELLGFIFACCLANNVRNYKRRHDY